MPGSLAPWIAAIGRGVRRASEDNPAVPPNIAARLKLLAERESAHWHGTTERSWLPTGKGRAVPSISNDVAKHWRKLASEARAVATDLTDPEAQQIMLRIAEGYERLARRAEQREKSSN